MRSADADKEGKDKEGEVKVEEVGAAEQP